MVARRALEAFVLLAAVLLFTRFGIHGGLHRDEAIYAYAGQQWAHGVPPEVSIFDPKGPFASALLALAALFTRAFGGDDLTVMRLLFFAISCATVVALFRLGTDLWKSTLAGVVTAITFLAFRGFAFDALGGPDAKTPAVLLAVLCMLALVHRRWALAALAGSLAALTWQPLVIYTVVAVVAAIHDRGPVRRTLIAAAAPLVVTALVFLAWGALGALWDGALAFPLTGIQRPPETVAERASAFYHVSTHAYGAPGFVLLGGMAALAVLLVAKRRQYAILATFLGLVAYTLHDFQGYPDVFPLLPYGALGIGGLAAVALGAVRQAQARRALTGAVAVGLAAVFALTFVWYSKPNPENDALRAQRAEAAKLDAVAGPGQLWSFGDPAPLVLTHRRNPTRYIYLGSGVAQKWEGETPGRLHGIEARLLAEKPALIAIVRGKWWHSPTEVKLERWLAKHRAGGQAGRWGLYVTPQAAARARAAGIPLRRVGQPRRF